jgi:hypothetical protein
LRAVDDVVAELGGVSKRFVMLKGEEEGREMGHTLTKSVMGPMTAM